MVIDLELARRLERVDALNSADYALTLAHRGRGIQAALLRERLRQGFCLAYTRLSLEKPR